MVALELAAAAAVLTACAGVWVWVDDRAAVRQARYANRYLHLADSVTARALETDLRVLATLHVATALRVRRRPHWLPCASVAVALTAIVVAIPLWWGSHPAALVGWAGAVWTAVTVVLAVEAPLTWGYVATLPRERHVTDEAEDTTQLGVEDRASSQ